MCRYGIGNWKGILENNLDVFSAEQRRAFGYYSEADVVASQGSDWLYVL
jgi:hypothetical protein